MLVTMAFVFSYENQKVSENKAGYPVNETLTDSLRIR